MRVESNDGSLKSAQQRCLYTSIDCFTGPVFDFLDNAFPSPVWFPHNEDFVWQPRIFQSAAHAILAARFNVSEKEVLQLADTASIADADAVVKSLQENELWISKRLEWVEQIVRDKYRRNDELRSRLEATGNRYLIWGNKNDSYFGQVNFKGDNHLGEILMRIRSDIQIDEEMERWGECCFDLDLAGDAQRPRLNLIELKDSNPVCNHPLTDSSMYTLGKLPACDVMARHPSISRRHALLCLTRRGGALLIDLKSKAGTFRNNIQLTTDNVAYPLFTNDKIKLGASTRSYMVELDASEVVHHFEMKQKELQNQIQLLSMDITDPLGLTTKSQTRLFLGNLPFNTTKDDIEDFFALQCGAPELIELPQSKTASSTDTASRGIAFVTLPNQALTRAALALDGRRIAGRPVKVSLADIRGQNDAKIFRTVTAPVTETKQLSNRGRNAESRNPFQVEELKKLSNSGNNSRRKEEFEDVGYEQRRHETVGRQMHRRPDNEPRGQLRSISKSISNRYTLSERSASSAEFSHVETERRKGDNNILHERRRYHSRGRSKDRSVSHDRVPLQFKRRRSRSTKHKSVSESRSRTSTKRRDKSRSRSLDKSRGKFRSRSHSRLRNFSSGREKGV